VFLFQDEYKEEAFKNFKNDVLYQSLNLNVEYKHGNVSYATLVNTTNNDEDIAKTLILEGLLMVESRKEKKMQKLVRKAHMQFALTALTWKQNCCLVDHC
jgi:staphylococcal nuclease domain-containing protein 1